MYNKAIKIERYGWSVTAPSDGLVEFCIENELPKIRLCRNDIVSFRTGVSGPHNGSTGIFATGKKKSSSRKYACPCCGMSVRATKEVRVMCMDCGEQLVLVGSEVFQMRMLSELWYGNIEPQDRTIPRNSEYKKLLSKICEYEEEFRGIFSPEQQTDFEDYENATISVTAISEEAAFV